MRINHERINKNRILNHLRAAIAELGLASNLYQIGSLDDARQLVLDGDKRDLVSDAIIGIDAAIRAQKEE